MPQNHPIPIIFFGFSNDSGRSLEMLEIESSYVWKMLKGLDKGGLIRVFREESLTHEELLDYLLDFKESIVAIHFAGHAGGQALYTQDGTTAPKGLKKILEKLPNLKLVFLNACDTAEQALPLLESGIPMVIATTLPVEDEKAAKFSKYFYGNLAAQASVQDAFEMAIGAVSSRKEWGLEEFTDSPAQRIIFTRGMQLDFDEAVLPPWRLFSQKGQEVELGQWKLGISIDEDTLQGKAQILAIASGVLEEHAEDFINQPDSIKEKIKSYFTRIIKQLDQKILLIKQERGPELSREIIQVEVVSDVFRGIQEHTNDQMLYSILSTAEKQLREIIDAKAQFIEKIKRSSSTDEEKAELIELLELAKVKFETLRDLL